MESDAATLHVANAVRGFRGGKRNAEIDEKFGESRSFLFRSREIERGRSRGASRAPQPKATTFVAIQDARTRRLPAFRFPNSIIHERSSEQSKEKGAERAERARENSGSL